MFRNQDASPGQRQSRSRRSTRQLDFFQAMSDFKNMFPTLDDEVIEAVLRANDGAVDATIDQLLTMTIDEDMSIVKEEAAGGEFNMVSYITVKFHYKDHSKLRPPSLLRPLVYARKCNFHCKWVSLVRLDHYQNILVKVDPSRATKLK